MRSDTSRVTSKRSGSAYTAGSNASSVARFATSSASGRMPRIAICVCGTSRCEVDRERRQAAHEQARHVRDLPVRTPERARASEERLEHDPCLETRQRRADAVVYPEPEGEMRLRI